MVMKNSGVGGSNNAPPSKKPRNLAINPSEAAVDIDLLDCPICSEPLQPPIHQCENGHLVCDTCYKNIHNKCPSCSLPIGSNRNRAVERIVESARVSCVYMQHGCTEKVGYPTKLKHENICNYTPISCLISSCDYGGAQNSIYMHCAENHSTCVTKFSFNTAKNFRIQDRPRYIFQESDEHVLFILHRIFDPLGSFVNVTCLAPTGSDTKFSYELSARIGDTIVCVISPMDLGKNAK